MSDIKQDYESAPQTVEANFNSIVEIKKLKSQ
jgi:hypothetical protein